MSKTQRPTTISEAVIGTYTEKNLPDVVTKLVSSGLLTLDQSGNPQNNLTSNWEVDKEAKTYTIKLKSNLFWNDGQKVNSQDIEFPIADTEVSYPSTTTIQVKLKDSFSPLPFLLTKPIFKKDSLIGIGPYSISQLDFFNQDRVFISRLILTPTDKSLPNVVLRFYPNEKIAKTALKLGEVQSVLGLTETEDFTKEKPFTIYSKEVFTKLVTIFYNTKDPILSDENFRLALSFSAPSIRGENEAKTSIPPNSPVFNPSVKDYLDNKEQAENYFNKVKNGKSSTILLTTTNSLAKVGEQVVEAWKKLGIRAVLRVESGIPQNFQALLISQELPKDPADQYSLWHSTQSQTNISRYSFVRVDKDLEDARKTTDLEIRKARYLDFQKVLMDHAPATFLYFPKYNVVYLKKVDPNLKKVLALQI